MPQQFVVGRLLEKLFPHNHSNDGELERLRAMHKHCQCPPPCPEMTSFFDKIHHKGQSLKLIAYIRACEIDGAVVQKGKIQQFCADRREYPNR